jgi:hypothetical protein
MALLPIRRNVCFGFLSPEKSLAGFEPMTHGSSGKPTNHYTTDIGVQLITK